MKPRETQIEDLIRDIGMTFDMLRAFILTHPEGDLEAACTEAERQVRESVSALLREEEPAPGGEEVADSREPLWLAGGSLIDAHARDMQAAIRHLFARFEHEGTASQKRQALHDLLVRELEEAHLNALVAGVPAAPKGGEE